jgi:hypothetical protein
MGSAAERTGATATVRGPAAAGPSSVTVPHAWHSPHRPAHFAVAHPHSVQRSAGRPALVEVDRLRDVVEVLTWAP